MRKSPRKAGFSVTWPAASAIADNKLTEAGEWSEELLRLELGDLHAAGFDLALTGFDQDELDWLLVVETELDGDPDDAPDPPAEPSANQAISGSAASIGCCAATPSSWPMWRRCWVASSPT